MRLAPSDPQDLIEGDLDEDDLALLEENTGLKLGARSKGSVSGKITLLQGVHTEVRIISLLGSSSAFVDIDLLPLNPTHLRKDSTTSSTMETLLQ